MTFETNVSAHSNTGAINPFGFTDVDIDQMIAKKDLVMVKPPKDTHKSDVWEAGLRLVCFPNSDAKTDWHRCMWCGHNWCLEKGKGTGNMRTHVFRHFTTPFQITPGQFAAAIEFAVNHCMNKGQSLKKDDIRNCLPIRPKNEEKLNW